MDLYFFFKHHLKFLFSLQQRAIAQVKEKGGIQKADPNTFKKSNPDVRDKIEKRLASCDGG